MRVSAGRNRPRAGGIPRGGVASLRRMTWNGEIRRAELTSEVALRLIGELNSMLIERFPDPGTRHFRLDPAEVAPGCGAFLVAYEHGVPLAVGGVRSLGDGVAEIKRMYVAPAARRRGVASAVLAALEDEARKIGARRIVLETGDKLPEAIALYRRRGYTDIPKYGEYVKSVCSV